MLERINVPDKWGRKAPSKWKTETSTNTSNECITSGHKMWRLKGKTAAQDAWNNECSQLAIRSLTCIPTDYSLPGVIYPFLPTPVVPLHFHFLHRTWFSIDDWKVWPLNERRYYSLLSSVCFSLLRLLRFFSIFLSALLACTFETLWSLKQRQKKKMFWLLLSSICKYVYLPTL